MPRYINKSSSPISYNSTTFISNQEVETYDTLENQAIVVGTVSQNYAIVVGVNDTLYIRFNEETAWTTVALTVGAARTAAQIVTDINTAYGSVVASVEGEKVRLDAPIVNNTLNSIYIGALSVQSTAAIATLGWPSDPVNPVVCVSLQAFVFSQNFETYNITSANNTFIFKVNENSNWITATLTIGAARTAAQIVSDINLSYEIATADATKVAFAVVPVTIDATVYVKLLAPIYNNYRSKIYIKSTDNTALTVLGFVGDNFAPVAQSSFPSLTKTSELPLYNPISAETVLTFAAAGTKHHYLTDPVACKEVQIIRTTIAAAFAFTCYIESVSNTPPFTLKSDETFSINLLNRRVSKLIVTAGAAGNLTIRELKG